jgi:8-oxo-dGTP diphosphatase
VGEEVDAAAWRELFEETGLTAERLELVDVYGEPGRDPRGRYVDWAFVGWSHGLTPPVAGSDAEMARWHPVDAVLEWPSGLAFDHREILVDALRFVNRLPAGDEA